MTTAELYHRLTASTLANIYFELTGSTKSLDVSEAAKVRAAGIANCGETDFNLLVKEIADFANA